MGRAGLVHGVEQVAHGLHRQRLHFLQVLDGSLVAPATALLRRDGGLGVVGRHLVAAPLADDGPGLDDGRLAGGVAKEVLPPPGFAGVVALEKVHDAVDGGALAHGPVDQVALVELLALGGDGKGVLQPQAVKE